MWHHIGRYESDLKLAYQLVWPCANSGLLPWEPHCHEDVIWLQPALYETRLN
jgi:hypothetical protein